MKIVLVYDSVYGNTEKLAIAIKEILSGKNQVELIKIVDFELKDIKGCDLFIIGSPTNAGNASEKIRILLKMLKPSVLEGIKVAVFDTSFTTEGQNIFLKGILKVLGFGGPKIARFLEKNINVKVVDVNTFFVMGMEGPLKDGEIERAKEWAKSITN